MDRRVPDIVRDVDGWSGLSSSEPFEGSAIRPSPISSGLSVDASAQPQLRSSTSLLDAPAPPQARSATSLPDVAELSPLTSACPVRVQWLNSCSDIPARLWDAFYPPDSEGRFWYWALENCGMDSQFSYLYGLITRGGEPIGIAPAFIMNVPMELVAPPLIAKVLRALGAINPALPYQRTFFVGSVCADELGIGLAKSVSFQDVAEALQEAVESKAKEMKAPMITWKDLPDSYTPAVRSLAKGHALWELPSYPGTSLTICDGSIESYFASLKGSRRHNLRKKLKRSKQNVQLETTVVSAPSESVLDEIFALFWQTYERGKTKFEILTREFFTLIASQTPSHFVLLRKSDDSRLVAFMLCFKLGDKVINKFIGLDYALPSEWYLYFRLWEAALEWVLATGAKEFQSGQTGYRAKIDVGHSLVPLTNFCKHRNPMINRIYEALTRDMSLSTLDDDLKVYLAAHPE